MDESKDFKTAAVKSLHSEDRPIAGTLSMWEQFGQSAVWRDMAGYLEDLRAELITLIINPDITNNMTSVKELQSAIRVCEYMLELPEKFIEEIKLSQQIFKEDEDGDKDGST